MGDARYFPVGKTTMYIQSIGSINLDESLLWHSWLFSWDFYYETVTLKAIRGQKYLVWKHQVSAFGEGCGINQ